MTTPQEAYWREYYSSGRFGPSLDYSNERVQAQTFAVALESAGPIEGRRCLDVGSGRGQFAGALHGLGASHVAAIELVQETVERLRRERPGIQWTAGSAADSKAYEALGLFDVAFALEVLQYVPLAPTLKTIWSHVRPGGRLVLVVPNGDCPIVGKARSRFQGHFDAPSAGALRSAVEALGDLDGWSYRGMAFQSDQSVVPYGMSPWTVQTSWEAPPNRFVLVARRKGATA